MYKGISETHADEILTNNEDIHYCNQCKDCRYWGNSDAFSNRYDKSNCDQFPYPVTKPMYVINNTGECEVYMKRSADDGKNTGSRSNQ